MKNTLNAIKEQVLPILNQHQIKRASLFGSILRQDFTPKTSDIDLLVGLLPNRSLFDLLKLRFELENKLGLPVDLIEYDMLKPRVKKSVLEKAVQIL